MLDLPDARDHALPCRPTVSCTADIATPGTFEVESGLLYEKLGGATREWSYPFLLKQTFSPLLQLQVASNGYTNIHGSTSARYLDNIDAGLKLHIRDQSDSGPSLALTAQLSVPTFQRDNYLRAYDGFATAHASKDLGALHVDWNVGCDLWRIDASPRAQAFSALAFTLALPPPFSVALEGYVFSDATPIATRDGGLRAALGMTPRPWLVFDLGGDAGFFPATRAYTLFFGMTIVPVVVWR
jgi:hypothetical protein